MEIYLKNFVRFWRKTSPVVKKKIATQSTRQMIPTIYLYNTIFFLCTSVHTFATTAVHFFRLFFSTYVMQYVNRNSNVLPRFYHQHHPTSVNAKSVQWCNPFEKSWFIWLLLVVVVLYVLCVCLVVVVLRWFRAYARKKKQQILHSVYIEHDKQILHTGLSIQAIKHLFFLYAIIVFILKNGMHTMVYVLLSFVLSFSYSSQRWQKQRK